MAPTSTPAKRTVTVLSSPTKRTPPRQEQDEYVAPSLSEEEKQTLLQNLQLEVDERARKLRSQYEFQAESLRMRLSMRVNRIPKALRAAKMDDLLLKYTNPASFLPPSRVAGMKRAGTNQDGRGLDGNTIQDKVVKRHKVTSSVPHPAVSRTKAVARQAPASSPRAAVPFAHLQPSVANQRYQAQSTTTTTSTLPRSTLSPTKAQQSRKPAPAKSALNLRNNLFPDSHSSGTENSASPARRTERERARTATNRIVSTDSTDSTNSSGTVIVRPVKKETTASGRIMRSRRLLQT